MIDYRLADGVAHISMDDGKVNALGSATLTGLSELLDRAEKEGAGSMVISGRDGVFSAGFNLTEIRDPDGARALRGQLIDLVLRLFESEKPVVIACSGHALAAGAALLLAGDRRVGTDGAYKLGFNEASLGVAISKATVELARYRMPMPWFESIITGQTFSPGQAVVAGLLDEVVDSQEALISTSIGIAEELAGIAAPAFGAMKRVARGAVADHVRLERSRL